MIFSLCSALVFNNGVEPTEEDLMSISVLTYVKGTGATSGHVISNEVQSVGVYILYNMAYTRPQLM